MDVIARNRVMSYIVTKNNITDVVIFRKMYKRTFFVLK